MIIFYEKSTGKITGTIEGRVHSEGHLKMWVGDREKIGRIIIKWKPFKWFTKRGDELPKECLDACDENGNALARVAEFEPDCEDSLKPIIIESEKKPRHFRQNYKFDTKTKKLIEKTKKEKADILKEKIDFDVQRKHIAEQKQKIITRIKDKNLPIEERFDNLVKVLNISRMK